MSDAETQLDDVATSLVADHAWTPSASQSVEAFAWEDSVDDAPDAERRPLSRPLRALLGFVAVGTMTLGGFILGTRTEHDDDIAHLKPVVETQTVTETPSAEEFLAYHDDAFTKELTDAAIPVGNMNAAVATGQGYCQYLGSGHRTADEQIDYMRVSYPQLTDADLGGFMGLSIRAFCPQFTYVFGPGAVDAGPATS